MSGYKKIAVAIDLSSESSAVMKRALDVAAPDSEIHLIYVQEPMDSVYMGVVPYGPVFVGMDEVEENLRSELRQKLDTIGEEAGVELVVQRGVHHRAAAQDLGDAGFRRGEHRGA